MRRTILTVFVTLLGSLALSAPASADTLIGSPGSGAGQYGSPPRLAVDNSTGHLYVADDGNNRIDVFDSSGAFLFAFGWNVNATTPEEKLQTCTAATGCKEGTSGGGAGQMSEPRGIAVDNDPASPAFHDIYVFEYSGLAEGLNARAQRFTPSGQFVWVVGGEVNKTTSADLCTAASGDTCGIGVPGDQEGHFNGIDRGGVAVGPGGVLYVGDQVGSGENSKSRVQKYEASGAYIEQLLLEVPGGSGGQNGIATHSDGSFYIATHGGTGAVRRYDASGSPIPGWGFSGKVDPSFNIRAIAVDSAGHLFVADNTNLSASSEIYEYDSAGLPVSTIYGTFSNAVTGLAPAPGGGIYISQQETSAPTAVFKVPFPPPGPVVVPDLSKAGEVRSTKAILESQVNPEGKATTYHFEYVDEKSYEDEGGFAGPNTLSTTETALTIPPGGNAEKLFRAYPAGPKQVTGLAPETTYRFRVVAEDSEGNVTVGPEATFTTLDPIEFGETWATGVGTDSAILHGEANPLESAATGYFEYVDQASFEASGFAEAAKAPDVDAGAAPLDFGEGEVPVERTASLHSLAPGTTYRYRLVATDHCKADPEIVCTFEGPVHSIRTFTPSTPSTTPCPANEDFRTGPAAFLPDCRGYEMVSPLEKNGADIDVLYTITGYRAGFDQAAEDGDSLTYSTYKAFGDIASAPFTNQYLARRDPGAGWLSEAISPKREGPSLMTFGGVQLDRQFKAFSPDLCSGWVVQDANPVLAEGGVEGFPGLYRRDDCELGTYEALSTVEPPNLLPENFRPELQGASADGSVAIFGIADNLTEDAPAQPLACVQQLNRQVDCLPRLYEAREGQLKLVCILPNGTPSAEACSAGGPPVKGAERYSLLANAISDDGSRIFWTSYPGVAGSGKLFVRVDGTETIQISAGETRFRAAAADGSKAIYTSGGKLFSFDVETATPTLIAEEVSGVAGASEDTSRIYFTSGKVLAPGATTGQPNLYFFEAGAGFRFIATLTSADLAADQPAPVSEAPIARASRVTPDGEQIAFMSQGSPTGYDNTDAVSGEADREVSLYDSTANGGAGELRCVSCNPSGARPVGRLFNVPGLAKSSVAVAARIPTFQSQLNGQRVLSDDGRRLYFNSYEGLVSHDTNVQEDVYQWEAPGSGDCDEESPSFLKSSGGCLSLISSGESPKGSELVDIGTNGDDVFFKTSAGLVPQDRGLIDIYDARVNGGFPPPEEPPAPCEGEACAPPAAAPNDPTPASAGFRGAGNPAPEGKRPRKSCPKGKRKVRKSGKTRCVKRQSKRHRQMEKQRQERAAR
jgi:hypothetical protein